MSGIPDPPVLTDLTDPSQLSALTDYHQTLAYWVKNATFLGEDGTIATNVKPVSLAAIWIQYVSNAVADTEDAVAHGLGYTPGEMWVGLPDKAARVYRGTTAWTSATIYLKASAATVTVNVLVF